MIHYYLKPLSTEAHIVQMRMEVALGQITSSMPQFRLPAWIPGSYMIRDFARHIISIKALIDGVSVPIVQQDKQTWQVNLAGRGGQKLVLEYQVYAFDLSVRGSFLDRSRGFFNPACLCLELEGNHGTACYLNLDCPEGEIYQHWQVATGLIPVRVDQAGFGCYQADSYDQLIDCPIEIGAFSAFTFEVQGIVHQFVLSGMFDANLAQLKADVQKICETQIQFFNGQTPFSRYVFLLHVSHDAYGGLEHKNSTALLASREWLPAKGAKTRSEDYIQLLGLISHEYFHAWNIKTIKPREFEPYNLKQEAYTEQLWAFEGITSYYDELFLLRSSLISQEQYLDLLAKNITRVQRGNGRTRQSLAQSSFNAWTKFYKQDENSVNAIVSYYQKGALLALCLDLLISNCTQQQKSLDDVMRLAYQTCQECKQGVVPQQWIQLIPDATGVDVSEFLHEALYGTDDLPLADLLQTQGIDYYWLAASLSTSGSFARQMPESVAEIDLGLKYKSTPSGVKVTHVLDNGSAQKAGISVGDELIAIDGFQIYAFEKQLQRFEAGQTVEFALFRQGILLTLPVKLELAKANTCFLCSQNLDQSFWLK